MNIYKYLVITLLGYCITLSILANRLLKDLKVRVEYTTVRGYVLEIGEIKYVRVDGVDWKDGEVVEIKFDKR